MLLKPPETSTDHHPFLPPGPTRAGLENPNPGYKPGFLFTFDDGTNTTFRGTLPNTGKRTMEHSVSDEDLPSIFRAADQNATTHQKIHFGSLAAFLLLSVLASGAPSALPAACQAIGSSIIFLGLICILGFMYFYDSERKWYYARALAESAKTRAWRYMMRAEPYQAADNEAQNETEFRKDLQDLLINSEERHLATHPDFCDLPYITDKMRSIRALSLHERAAVYRQMRIADQLNYYSTSSKRNRISSRVSFSVAALFCVFSIVLTFLKTMDPSFLSTTTSCVIAVVSWMQSKRYRELSASYALTALEICQAQEEGSFLESNQKLSDFVIDTETAFSREHTQWAARKSN